MSSAYASAQKRQRIGGKRYTLTPGQRHTTMVMGARGTRGFNVYRNMPHGLGARGETKAVDLATAAYACDTTGTVTAINLIRAGSSFNNRIGRKIAMKSLYLTGSFQPQAAGVSESYCRVVVVYDAQCNGALPTWANVFTNYDQALGATSDVKAGVNLDFRDRFRILADLRVIMPALAAGVVTGPAAPTATEVQIKEYRKLGNIEAQYKADSAPAVIGDVATGSLILLTFGDQAAASGWNASISVRLRFTDN